MKHIKIGVFYGTLFSPNLGCCALNYSLLELLEGIAEKRNEHYSYYFFWDVPGSFSAECLPRELRKYDLHFVRVPNSLLRLFCKGLIKDRMHSFKEFLSAIKQCDVFMDSCAGDSFSDIYGTYSLDYIRRNHRLAEFFKKPMVMLPQTIGPFQHPWAKKVARKLMADARIVFSRDQLSQKCACEMIDPQKVSESVDMALFMPYSKTAVQFPHDRKNVILAPSALLWNGGYTQDNQFSLRTFYPDLIRALADHLRGRADIRVILLGHVLGGSAATPREDDYYLCKRLQYEYPEFDIAPYFYTPIEAKNFLAAGDAVISSRMHCCIGAYSAGVPVFPLGYSRKFEGLFEKNLNYSYGADLRKSDIPEVIESLDDFLTSSDAIRTQLKSDLSTIEQHRTVLESKLEQIMAGCEGGEK